MSASPPPTPEADLAQRVAAVLAATRPGEVLTYGEVAREAGVPGAARAVGRALATSGDQLPWWRVVTASGRLVPGHERVHADHLAEEGVVCRDGFVTGFRANRTRSLRVERTDGEPVEARGRRTR
jgi:methylated-DNA-protein-cysteine methyltransferase related protein